MSVRDDILSMTPGKVCPLKIKGLSNGPVAVREICAREQDDFDAEYSAKGRVNRAAYVALCLVSPDGTPIFSGPDDAKLAEVSEKTIGLLYAACTRVNGVSVKDVDEALGN